MFPLGINTCETTQVYPTTQFNIIGPTSYAQACIWFEEQHRFDPQKPQVAIYNMPFLYRLSRGGILSITQLRQALQLIIMKHESLRTSIFFDTHENVLMQRIIEPRDDDHQQLYTLINSIFNTEEDLKQIMHDEQSNPKHFILSKGLVFRCHIVRHKHISHDDFLFDNDAIIFNFHHACFDFLSMDIFHRHLDQAYATSQLTDESTVLRYLDC